MEGIRFVNFSSLQNLKQVEHIEHYIDKFHRTDSFFSRRGKKKKEISVTRSRAYRRHDRRSIYFSGEKSVGGIIQIING